MSAIIFLSTAVAFLAWRVWLLEQRLTELEDFLKPNRRKQ